MPFTLRSNFGPLCGGALMFIVTPVVAAQTPAPKAGSTTTVVQRAAAPLSKSDGMTNADVIQMTSAKLGEDVILNAIEDAPTRSFDLSATALVELKKAGVTDAVIRGRYRATRDHRRGARACVTDAGVGRNDDGSRRDVDGLALSSPGDVAPGHHKRKYPAQEHEQGHCDH